MKILQIIINAFLILTVLTTNSCKKEEQLKPNNTVVNNNQVYELLDIDWVLHSGRFYMENMDNGDKNFYDHFGLSQFQSTLDPINGADIPFDTISQGITTWRFTSNNFILNNVNYYEFTYTENTVVAVGMENGSSRPMTIIDIDDISITFKVHEAYGSIDGVNYSYYTTLTFIKSGSSCTSCEPNSDLGYVYQGVIDNNTSINNIINTKWVVTRYDEGLIPYYPNDTLHFINNNEYTINNGTYNNYTLSNIFGNNMTELTLYNFYTIGGDYSGMVLDSFIEDYQINASIFTDIFNTGTNKTVWMVRIQ